eukprot:7086659-Alexandrium_andersonii.AAC.1
MAHRKHPRAQSYTDNASAWPPGAATGVRTVGRRGSSCRRRPRCSGLSIARVVGHWLSRSARSADDSGTVAPS